MSWMPYAPFSDCKDKGMGSALVLEPFHLLAQSVLYRIPEADSGYAHLYVCGSALTSCNVVL